MKDKSASSTGKHSPEPSNVSHQDFWRRNLFNIYRDLLKRWQGISPCATALKTDLYDEAQTDYSPLFVLNSESRCIAGIDISFEIAQRARERSKGKKPNLTVLACDVRSLAFKPESFDLVISASTLDHFQDKNDIARSLNEICRVLKSKGSLIITLDNIHNPVVKLRNLLPYSWLKSLKVISYPIGKSVSLPELSEILESNGFKVCEALFIDHHPRILTVWLGYALQKTGIRPLESFFQKILNLFERLQRSPIGSLTGYFLAVKATRKDDDR